MFRDRREAGRQLASQLIAYKGRPDIIVLALPRGGVPVAYEVARALGAPLDVFIVRKLGVPGYEELAMGAVATGGMRVINADVVDKLGIPQYLIDAIAQQEEGELARRERVYRGGRAPPQLRGRTVILVDDGLATGSTMLAAIRALRQRDPARIAVAVPVASRDTCDAMRAEADEVVCLLTPEPFQAVGRWYEDFSQTSDDEVRELLARARQRSAPPPEDSKPEASGTGLTEAVRRAARRLDGGPRDYDSLLSAIGDARFVLLGEASHGTDDFYRERARITRRLIEEKGFSAIAVEADWPDAYRVNRFVRGASDDLDAREALRDFRRFPTWMWRNTAVEDFVNWLRQRNNVVGSESGKAGFYGLDLYSLHASMKAVLSYLEKVDPEAARAAADRYACFDHFGPDPQVYGFIAGVDVTKSCQDEVIRQLVEMLQRRAAQPEQSDPALAEDELFSAQQNARLVKNAEEYYRAMFLNQESTWNLRDRHMVETLEALAAHLGRHGGRPRVVVWAHNSHLGDARATEMSRRGELNVGQLVREKYGRQAMLVGFTTHQGTVTAASDWDAPAERKNVRPSLAGSYEELFHAALPERFLLDLRANDPALAGLREQHLERAIGVIYRPETERVSHYFHARLPEQFDAVLHFDETQAVEPLEITPEWQAGDLPETFPFTV